MSKPTPNESLGILLAAEVDFLHANGWQAKVIPETGEVFWKEPGNMFKYAQDLAVKRTRRRIEEANALLKAGWTQNVDSRTGEESWTRDGNPLRYTRDHAYKLEMESK